MHVIFPRLRLPVVDDTPTARNVQAPLRNRRLDQNIRCSHPSLFIAVFVSSLEVINRGIAILLFHLAVEHVRSILEVDQPSVQPLYICHGPGKDDDRFVVTTTLQRAVNIVGTAPSRRPRPSPFAQSCLTRSPPPPPKPGSAASDRSY